jgi:transcriptional regulator with XRE-family HTH domain
MASKAVAARGDWSAEMRLRSGQYLRDRRLAAGLTQAQLAKLCGFAYFTMISQIELGRGFVPPERYIDFAMALGIEPKEFVEQQLKFSNPWAWAVLYGTPQDLQKLADVPARFAVD